MTILRPACKLNFGLRVTGWLPNGYHKLSSFLYPVPAPADVLIIRKSEAGNFELRCNNPELESGFNLLRRAWQAFGEATDCWNGYALYLRKNIPPGAGLGGASSDAACFLAFLNREAGYLLSPEELNELAFSLGADVPFFLHNFPCLIRDAGECPLPVSFRAEGMWVVVVFPGITISTAMVFREWDKMAAEQGRPAPALKEPLFQEAPCSRMEDVSDLTKVYTIARKTNSVSVLNLENDLESACVALWPALGKLKEQLLDLGAESAAMSGSGSSFYGVYNCERQAQLAAETLRACWPRVYCLRLRDFGM